MVAPKTNAYSLIEAKPFSPHLGAEVYGVDLSETISDAQFAEILDAFLKYQVLFFKNQKEIPPEQHVIFGKRFGPLHAHPAAPTRSRAPMAARRRQSPPPSAGTAARSAKRAPTRAAHPLAPSTAAVGR